MTPDEKRKQKMMEAAEYIRDAVKSLSWFASYRDRVKEDGEVLSILVDEPGGSCNFFIHVNTEDCFIEVFGGDYQIARNEAGRWELSVWHYEWNNHNGDADSDYALISDFPTIHEAAYNLLLTNARNELDCWAESRYMEEAVAECADCAPNHGM